MTGVKITDGAVRAWVSEVRGMRNDYEAGKEGFDALLQHERSLWRDVLETIHHGVSMDAMQMQILAREALKTLDSTGV